jgi:DNA-binding NarL/FixJ family response regulator
VREIRLNETGRRIGESHPNTKLTDHDVELILALVDEGLSYTAVAEKFEVSKSCIQHIVSGRNRGQWAARLIRVSVSMDRGD